MRQMSPMSQEIADRIQGLQQEAKKLQSQKGPYSIKYPPAFKDQVRDLLQKGVRPYWISEQLGITMKIQPVNLQFWT